MDNLSAEGGIFLNFCDFSTFCPFFLFLRHFQRALWITLRAKVFHVKLSDVVIHSNRAFLINNGFFYAFQNSTSVIQPYDLSNFSFAFAVHYRLIHRFCSQATACYCVYCRNSAFLSASYRKYRQKCALTRRFALIIVTLLPACYALKTVLPALTYFSDKPDTTPYRFVYKDFHQEC